MVYTAMNRNIKSGYILINNDDNQSKAKWSANCVPTIILIKYLIAGGMWQ